MGVLVPILGVLALLAMPIIAVVVSYRDRTAEQKNAPEITEVPIDWGVGSQLPNGAVRLAPHFGGHPADCTRCKHQAHGISAA